MLTPAYLSRQLTSSIPTKDGGALRTIGDACEYTAAIGEERGLRLHWQRVRELMLQEAEAVALSSRVRLAVLKDAKLDVTSGSTKPSSLFGFCSKPAVSSRSRIPQVRANLHSRRSGADIKFPPER
jgi:hypothetical protein